MIKGINKQVLEVTNPESPYFDKIVFFVKEKDGGFNEKRLKEEAEKISSTAQKPPREKKSVKQLISIGLFVLLGAGAGYAINFLISVVL